ncbi:MAG: hypothetical protein KGZ84_08285 [Erysipelotrichia bacterium]|jgi:predicted RNA-binding Zn-ribbon protein involved in translation (DUF1610 family)|nr:hypothetical protein [Erysipelotrichia bacterium]
MKRYLRNFVHLDKTTRQTQIVALLIALFVVSIFNDVMFNRFMFPFGFIRLILGFFFYVFFALHVYLILKERQNMENSAKWIGIGLSFVVYQWVGNFGSFSVGFPFDFFVNNGLPQLLVIGYGAVLVNQVIAEESEKPRMKDDRYTPPEFRSAKQQNMDMTPKVHRVNATEASTTSPTKWYCPSCGEAIPQNSKRCPKCKEKIDF